MFLLDQLLYIYDIVSVCLGTLSNAGQEKHSNNNLNLLLNRTYTANVKAAKLFHLDIEIEHSILLSMIWMM